MAPGGGPNYNATTVSGGGAPMKDANAPQKFVTQYYAPPVQGGGTVAGANSLTSNPQYAATLQALVQALTALTQLLQAQAGTTTGGGAAQLPAAPVTTSYASHAPGTPAHSH